MSIPAAMGVYSIASETQAATSPEPWDRAVISPERRAAPWERGPLASPRALWTLVRRYVCYPRFVFSLLKVHCTRS